MRGHLWVEKYLTDLIRGALPEPTALKMDRMGFAQKVQLSVALGVVSESDAQALRTINTIRNKLAHDLHAEPTTADIDLLVQQITEPSVEVYRVLLDEHEGQPTDNQRLECFVHSTIALLEWKRMNRSYEDHNQGALSTYRMVRAVSEQVGREIDDATLRAKYGVPDRPDSRDIWLRSDQASSAASDGLRSDLDD